MRQPRSEAIGPRLFVLMVVSVLFVAFLHVRVGAGDYRWPAGNSKRSDKRSGVERGCGTDGISRWSVPRNCRRIRAVIIASRIFRRELTRCE